MSPIVNAAAPGCTYSPGSMLRVRITPSSGRIHLQLVHLRLQQLQVGLRLPDRILRLLAPLLACSRTGGRPLPAANYPRLQRAQLLLRHLQPFVRHRQSGPRSSTLLPTRWSAGRCRPSRARQLGGGRIVGDLGLVRQRVLVGQVLRNVDAHPVARVRRRECSDGWIQLVRAFP